VIIGLGLILQVPNAVALGVLAGLGNIIPYIGYYAALIPIAIFALASSGPVTMLLAILIYFIVGEIENKLVTPTVVKHELNIPPGLILLFQIIAGALMGFLGILLAVPILAILITLIRELYVYDGLGKRGRVTQVTETATGQVALVLPPEEGVEVLAEDATADEAGSADL
jgi:predicted PurR-regulated permease PerM